MSENPNIDGSPKIRDLSTATPAPTDDNAGHAESDNLLEENRKRSTSGLSWDEVVKDDKTGWNQITEEGEGD